MRSGGEETALTEGESLYALSEAYGEMWRGKQRSPRPSRFAILMLLVRLQACLGNIDAETLTSPIIRLSCGLQDNDGSFNVTQRLEISSTSLPAGEGDTSANQPPPPAVSTTSW